MRRTLYALTVIKTKAYLPISLVCCDANVLSYLRKDFRKSRLPSNCYILLLQFEVQAPKLAKSNPSETIPSTR